MDLLPTVGVVGLMSVSQDKTARITSRRNTTVDSLGELNVVCLSLTKIKLQSSTEKLEFLVAKHNTGWQNICIENDRWDALQNSIHEIDVTTTWN